MESGSVELRGWCPLWSQGQLNGGAGVPGGVSFGAGEAVDSDQVSHSLIGNTKFNIIINPA
eukprot:3530707-Rhodomonas_salina.1